MSVASLLHERITIQQLTMVDDGYGGKTASWTDFFAVFAQVEPIFIGQNEKSIGSQRNANAGYRVRVRTRTDIDASMRILWKTHTLTIHSLHEQGEILSILTYEENV